jgi:hypothetical protein
MSASPPTDGGGEPSPPCLSRRTLWLPAAAGLMGLAAPRDARAASRGAPADPTTGRSVVFDEPFRTLDRTVWQAGPKATTFDTGFYGRAAFSRWGGEEGFDPYAIVDDPEAEDGRALQISVKYIGRPMRVPQYYGNTHPEFQWIGGNIQTARPDGSILRGWRNGYFEARMKMPRHPLTWPAFWMMNGRSILFPRTSVELDIVEHKGFEPDLYGTYLHEWGDPGQHHEGIGVPTGVDVTQGYHRYGMLVDGALCVPYFDRQTVTDSRTGQATVWTIGRAEELDARADVFWPLLTLALRSDVPYPSPLLPEHHLAHLRVDQVLVFQ